MPITHDDGERVKSGDYTEFNNFLQQATKFKNPETYVLVMRSRIAEYKKRPSTRDYDYHLAVDRMFIRYHKHFDHAEAYKQIMDKCVKSPEEDDYRNLVAYETHILRGLTKETKEKMFDWLEEGAERTSKWLIADLLGALAVKKKITLDSKQMSAVVKRCRSVAMRQELAAMHGEFRLTAIKATEFRDAYSSYNYIKRWSPETMKDEDTICKKLRFDKHPALNLLYMKEYGLGFKFLEARDNYEDYLSAAIKLLPEVAARHPDELAQFHKDNFSTDEYDFLFGTLDKRMDAAASGVSDRVVLISLCRNMDDFLLREIDKDDMEAAKNPADQILKIKTAADY
jgi:hypothetical protein